MGRAAQGGRVYVRSRERTPQTGCSTSSVKKSYAVGNPTLYALAPKTANTRLVSMSMCFCAVHLCACCRVCTLDYRVSVHRVVGVCRVYHAMAKPYLRALAIDVTRKRRGITTRLSLIHI